VVSFSEGIVDGANKVYTFTEGVETKYGYIPARYASAEDYPFVVFRNGSFVVATALFGKDASESALNNSKAQGSVILLRRDFVYNEGQYNNLSQTYTEIVLDLDGHTFTSVARRMFTVQKKTANNTGITVKNGSIILGAAPLMTFSSWDPSTGGWEPYKGGCGFDLVFENVKISLAEGAATQTLICNNSFAATDPDQFVNLTFKNCILDTTGSAKSNVTLFDVTSDLCKVNIVIEGGRIKGNGITLLADNGAHADSALCFAKNSDGKYTELVLASENAPDEIAVLTDKGVECIFKAGAENDGFVTYSLVPTVVSTFKVKSSVSFWSDLIYNIYVPVNDAITSAILDGKAIDLRVYETVSLEGADYYRISIALPSSEALRDIHLALTVNADKEYNFGYTFSTLAYAKTIASGEYSVEERTLAFDMLSYLRAAYAYFGADGAQDVIEEIDKLLGEGYDAANAPDTSFDAKAPTTDIGLSKVTLSLTATPAYRFYLKEGYSKESFTFTVGGAVIEATEGEDVNGRYLEIVTYAYRMLYDVVISSTEGKTETYNVYSYYKFASEEYSDNAYLTALVERFIKYCQSASAYRDFVISD
jgi:hypothetical protein